MACSEARGLVLAGAAAAFLACGGGTAVAPAAVGGGVEEAPSVPAAAVEELGADGLAGLVASSDATVLVWWSRACPCVRRYDQRMLALAEQWPDAHVTVVAVSSNADESPDDVRAEFRARGLTVPLLFDDGGMLAARFGVRSTPTAVVLDPAGTAVFVGWIDNEREPGVRGRVAYVEQAVEGLLSGSPGPASSPTYGCAIARDLRRGCCTGP